MVKAGPLEKKQFFKGLSGRTTNKYFLGFLYLLEIRNACGNLNTAKFGLIRF